MHIQTVTAASNIKGTRKLSFSVVRHGNVMNSRGCAIPLLLGKAKSGTLQITDQQMTRIDIPLEGEVKIVIWALENALEGVVLRAKYRATESKTL